MTVKAILSRKGSDIVTIKPTATLCDAVTVLDMRRIGAVVITDSNQLILGILSERDIVRTLAHNARVAGGCHLAVEKVMTREVATCKQSDTVYDLMERMTRESSDISPWSRMAGLPESFPLAMSLNTVSPKWRSSRMRYAST